MGLISQLIPALVCLLACTSNFIQGCKYDITLQEIIKTLNNLTDGKGKNSCMELTVADAFAGPKNTDGKEICRAAKVLQQLYKRHDRSLIKECLSGLDRNLKGMANRTCCTVNEAKKSTLKDFLERLKTIMKEKYSKCQS
ncbi:interleukin-4 isoform X2 [Equus quagga]|uniref:interleukin-4 isoform X2 n=1 Tax=Equus quagga TaxID=89248 RepID=UPI001EE15F06|nr:interleukin-4 isoform X2 [Equus quagga]